jgi:hypothetical protein
VLAHPKVCEGLVPRRLSSCQSRVALSRARALLSSPNVPSFEESAASR